MASKKDVGVRFVADNVDGFMRGFGKVDAAIAGFVGGVASKAVDVLVDIGKKFVDLAVGTVQDAISIESAFTGVTKTTDGLSDKFGTLTDAGVLMKKQFLDLSETVPMTVEDLMRIGEIGGQLGIGEKQLLSFTETITAMGVSTDLSTEEAATGLARFATVMNSFDTEKLQERGLDANDMFSRLGSTVVELGNRMATSEPEILNFAQRIAGAGNIAGLTEADVFGISGAFSAVGIEAEAGGTAVQKVLMAMNQAVLQGNADLEVFAATSGLTAEEFGQVWEADAGAGFLAFVQGLGDAGDEGINILSALGLEDQRLIRSFLSLAGAGDKLQESMKFANDAFKENTALSDEATKFYNTTESQLKILKNQFRNVGYAIGNTLLPFLTQLMENLAPFISELGDVLVPILENVVAPILERVGELIGNFAKYILMVVQEGDTMNDFLANLPEGLQPIAKVLGEVVSAIMDFVTNLDTNMAKANTFIQGFRGTFDEVFAFVQQLIAIFLEWWNENMPLMIETGQTIMTFWEEHIVPALDNVWNIIKILVENGLRNILSLVTLIMQIITGDWEGAWETIKTIVTRQWDNIKRMWNEFLEGVLNALGSTTAEFTEMWNNNWEMAKTIVETIWTKIKEGFTQWVQDTLQAGRDIIDGFVSGVKEKAQRLIDAVRGAVSDAIEAAKKLLHIGSPSKVFEEFGRGISEGMALGILEKAPLVQGAVDEMISRGEYTADRVTAVQGPMVTNWNRSITMNFGPTTIRNGMDLALFEQRVKGTIIDEIVTLE